MGSTSLIDQVEAVRQAASKCLVVLGTGVSAVLVVALEGICQRVNAVMNNNRPSLAVRTHLLELLVGGVVVASLSCMYEVRCDRDHHRRVVVVLADFSSREKEVGGGGSVHTSFSFFSGLSSVMYSLWAVPGWVTFFFFFVRGKYMVR